MNYNKTILIIGAGYLGRRVAHFATNERWNVIAARRSVLPEIDDHGVSWVQLDVTDAQTLKQQLQNLTQKYSITAAVYCVSAGQPSVQAYRNAYEVGIQNVIQNLPADIKLVFVSSTGVYAQNAGEAVDELSFTSHDLLSETQAKLLSGEKLVQMRPNSIVARLSGIYGPNRIRMISLAQGLGETLIVREKAFTNRIHVDDGARAIIHLINSDISDATFCITDHDPAPHHEVLIWIRKAMAIPAVEVVFQTGDHQRCHEQEIPATNKRISNQKLLSSGFTFHFPTFREGYSKLL